MVNDKQMKYMKSKDGMDYFIFSPTIFRQYYNKSEDWTPHRKSFTHKLHMLFYHIMGGYRILYMMDGEKIAAYIAFTRCSKWIIKGSSRNDIFTIFITTHPNYRRKGLATRLVHEMLYGIDLEYENAYKIIADSNIGSQEVALTNGYTILYPAKKSKVLKTITKADNEGWMLFALLR